MVDKLVVLQPEPQVIEIVCPSFVHSHDASSLLAELDAIIQRGTAPISLLYEATAVAGFDFGFPMAHVKPFIAWRGKLHRVAVAHRLGTIKLAIATVSMAAKATIRGFASRDEAAAWLRQENAAFSGR